MEKETERQAFHLLLGVAALLLFLQFGRGFMTGMVFFIIITGTLLMNIRLRGGKLPLIQWFEERFERADAMLPGWGSACYAAGVLMLLTFLPGTAEIAASILVLGLADALSTVVGLKGRVRLPYNKGKSVEGTVAFFLAALPAWYFIGPAAVPLALAAAVAESLPALEDNLTVPAACVLFFAVAA
jgi:dolichol kinase